MGVVWRAHDRQLDRQVAVKQTRRGTRLLEERLKREAQALARLDHPHLLRVLDLRAGADAPYLVLELVEQPQTLAELLPGTPRERLLDWLTQAAEALGEAHRAGIVHRDVKPENMLVDADGTLRVTDFGLALLADQERLTVSGVLTGTPLYMAPEQLGAERHEYGPATDVWGLGVILYQVLTGALPFEGRNLVEQCSLLQRAPAPPSVVADDVPPALEAVCLRALSQAPGHRQRDGAAFAAALRRARQPAPQASARPPGLVLAAAAIALAAALAPALLSGTAPAPAPAASPGSASPQSRAAELAQFTILRLGPDEGPRPLGVYAPRLIHTADGSLLALICRWPSGLLELWGSPHGRSWTRQVLPTAPLPRGGSLVGDPSGGVHLAFEAFESGEQRRGVWYAHRSPAGVWSTPREVLPYDTDAQVEVSHAGIQLDPRTRAPLVTGLRQRFWDTFLARGGEQGWSAPERIAPEGTLYGFLTSLAVSSDGAIHASYRVGVGSVPASPGHGYDYFIYGIRYRRWDPRRGWGPELWVADHTDDASVVRVGSDGAVYVLYQQKRISPADAEPFDPRWMLPGSLELATLAPGETHFRSQTVQLASGRGWHRSADDFDLVLRPQPVVVYATGPNYASPLRMRCLTQGRLGPEHTLHPGPVVGIDVADDSPPGMVEILVEEPHAVRLVRAELTAGERSDTGGDAKH